MKDENDNFTGELPIKPPAKTNAQRQKEYRQRVRSKTQRIDVRLNWESVFDLNVLAVAHGLSQKAMLEKLIGDAEKVWRNTVTDEELQKVNEEFESLSKSKSSRKEKLAIFHSKY